VCCTDTRTREDAHTKDRLNHRLEGTDDLSSFALHETLRELFGGAVDVRLTTRQKLSRSRVYRVEAESGGVVRSLILKRVSPHVAQRNEMIVKRWLPAVGLSQAGPSLLAVAAERDGKRVWHVYEDLGDCPLAANDIAPHQSGCARLAAPRVFHAEPERIEVAVRLIAQIHARYARHPLLAECRLYGSDFGSQFFTSAVTDAIRSLEALLAPERELPAAWTELLDRLLTKMQRLARQQPERTEVLTHFGGPETLLHGDLWPINVMVWPDGQALRASLVDWDSVGVGPVSYDLSSFAGHFPRHDRQRIMDLYLQCMERLGWRFVADTPWNLLFDTAECARLALTIVWDALTALDDPSAWAFEDLNAVDEWFELLEPILPANPVEEKTHR
jgi:phosphotransferase family enzyme